METAWHLSRLCRIHVRCQTQSTVFLLRWCPVPGGAAAAIATLFFPFLPTFFFSLSTLLIFGFFRSEEFIDFLFSSFLWSSHNSVGFVVRTEFRVPSCCFIYTSLKAAGSVRIHDHIRTPKERSTCKSTSQDGVQVNRMYDYGIVWWQNLVQDCANQESSK